MKRQLSRTMVAIAAGVLHMSMSPVMAGVAAAEDAGVPVQRAAAGQAIAGHYIVTLRDGVDATAVGNERTSGPTHVYDSVLNGFAAPMTDSQLAALRADDRVVAIEEDQVMSADVTQFPAPWHLGRIDHRDNNSIDIQFYDYTETGDGDRVYVLDTGMLTSHGQFGSRALFMHNAVGDGVNGDCHGHGTHVAGIVGSTTYGVAKQSLLRAVKVLGCSGSAATSTIIAGVNWVRNNAIRPAVANLSLGGGYSHSLNSAVTALSYSGIFVAAAAGNEAADACNYSPASSLGAVTVAASTKLELSAGYTNRGVCVDLYAPGSSVTSTWNNGGTNTLSGTSMAAPVVAGVAALRKGAFGDTDSNTLRNQITSSATSGVILGVPYGTPNKLIFKDPFM